ncbi:fimbrial biogenesis chaperone [Pseudomonas sp. MT3]|uniref:fimbrial biogenesis chaperone n=1 Tax=Pseudomonas sp. ATCC 13867 TaxID=1294143 RepID=UPI0002C4E2C6|nr:fimbria/pilus periplasmic chaperone [Pseudomonas sp. ATCC 13867]AGI22549.1 chaperone protein ecpD [Pseudomonas sp. ATCC 13867]RFQ29916.1 molecular chaperone [Pseudomonas sp. ATCC 13867]
MRRSLSRTLLTSLVAVASLSSLMAQANVVITGTRVVYPAAEREVTVKLTNAGTTPALVQAWVDRGDPKTRPEQSDAPFVVTPPVARLDASKGQTLRIAFTGESLPGDRESVFWLNVLDVPPLPTQKDINYMQVAYRSRIKLFYRPAGLPGNPSQAAEKLAWTLTPDAHGLALNCTNASAYHLSLGRVTLLVAGKRFTSDADGMVRPGSTMSFPLKGLATPPTGEMKVTYNWINDYGASIPGESLLRR